MGAVEKLDNEVLAVVVPHSGQGTETFIRRYCQEICPERTVLIHFYRGAGQWSINGPVYSLPTATFGTATLWKAFRGVQKICGIKGLFGDPYTSRSLIAFLRRHRVTSVFSQYLTAGWNVHPVVKRLGLRHVVRGHGFDISAALKNPETCQQYQALADADAIVVPTPYQVERLRQIGLSKANLVSVPYGVDIPSVRSSRRVSTGDKTVPVRLLAVGRMVRKKAPLAVMQAFLKAAESLPALQLTYIGTGPLEAEVREYIERHDQGGRIHLAGAQSHEDVLRAMDAADIFIQHSMTDPRTGDQEGAPVAILEAMAHGLPVISTIHSGIPHLVVNGETGLLTPEGDVSAMANSIVQLARSQEMCCNMGATGAKRAELFSWQNERQKLRQLLFPSN